MATAQATPLAWNKGEHYYKMEAMAFLWRALPVFVRVVERDLFVITTGTLLVKRRLPLQLNTTYSHTSSQVSGYRLQAFYLPTNTSGV